MSAAVLGNFVHAAWKAASNVASWLVASAVDLLLHLTPWQCLVVVLVFLALLFVSARIGQARVNRRLRATPGEPVSMLSIEITGFPLLAALSEFRRWWGNRKKKKPEPTSLLVASHGPSYLVAAMVVVGARVFGELTAPVLRVSLGLSWGLPPWEHLVFGRFVGFGMLQPTVERPYQSALVVVSLWLVAWWFTARALRVFFGDDLGRNLHGDRSRQEVLPFWRTSAGHLDLWTAGDVFRGWNRWILALATPLFAIAWGTIDGRPAPVETSWFAVALCAWASSFMNLLLVGVDEVVVEKKPEEEPPPPLPVGWPEVLSDLASRSGVTVPSFALAPRAIAKRRVLPSLTIPPPCSSLIAELVPGAPSGHLTSMQAEMLARFARLGFVHVPPPDVGHDLKLKAIEAASPTKDQPRHHLVLAPEGAGRTTLLVLAACDHVLVHGKSVLVIVRDDIVADRLGQRLETIVSGSTLRWNIRVKRCGPQTLEDVARQVTPDVVVASLRELVVEVLAHPDSYDSLLGRLGLVLLDDVEDYAGAVEIHAQLAFRRLWRRVAHVQQAAAFDKRTDPITVALAAETMQDIEQWARSLIGLDLVVHREGIGGDAAAATITPPTPSLKSARIAPARTTGDQEDAKDAAAANVKTEGDASADESKGVDTAGDGDDDTLKASRKEPAPKSAPARAATRAEEAAALPGFQLPVRLGGFVDSLGQSLRVEAIVESCERLGVAWSYRCAGDGRRHLGRSQVRLREEPEHYVDDPTDAHVVFIDGVFVDVWREWQRLTRAGARAVDLDGSDPPKRPVGFVFVGDEDEAVAFEQRDTRGDLARQIALLPRPLIRAPRGQTVKAHFASELLGGWSELKDVLDVFDVTIAETIRALAHDGLIISEARPDLPPGSLDFEDKVYVRLLARALELGANGQLLPDRVVDGVEHAADHVAPVVDRGSLTVLAGVDRDTARYHYYAGRIFETARGRFIVASRAGLGQAEQSLVGDTGVAVDSFLEAATSAPRRQLKPVASGKHDIERVLLGDLPLRVSSGSTTVHVENLATLQLEPGSASVRQRSIHADDSEARAPFSFATEAVWIRPVDEKRAELAGDDGPRLTLRMARLVVAMLRMVLPNLQRRGDVDLDVALWLAPPTTTPVVAQEAAPIPSTDATNGERWKSLDEPLGPDDAIVVFDLQSGGNGASSAFRRDGLELALRLVRVAIERVLDPSRILARYDHQATLAEMEAEARARRQRTGTTTLPTTATTILPTPTSTLARIEYETLRRDTLAWLDARLRREGQPPSSARANIERNAHEAGEGDDADLGRVWMTLRGRSGDVVWTRHAWSRPDGEPLTIDIGFDRALLATDGKGGPRDKRLLGLLEQARSAAAAIEGNKSNHAKEPSDGPTAKDEKKPADEAAGGLGPRTTGKTLRGADTNDGDAVLAAAVAVIVEDTTTLQTLRDVLARHPRLQGYNYDDVVAALVRAMPVVAHGDPKRMPTSPLIALSERAGDGLTKALLHCALRSPASSKRHLFYAPTTGDAAIACFVTKIQKPDQSKKPKAAQMDSGDDDAALAMRAASDEAYARGAEPPPFAGVLPLPGASDTLEVYAPEFVSPGASSVAGEAWILLPLDLAWEELDRRRAVAQRGVRPTSIDIPPSDETSGLSTPTTTAPERTTSSMEQSPAPPVPSATATAESTGPATSESPSTEAPATRDRPGLAPPGAERHTTLHVTDEVRTLADQIVGGVDDAVCACLELFEWMHANIAYKKDGENYDVDEYVATPEETLGRRSGDCEDHAILLGSLAWSRGIRGHFILAPKHAAYTFAFPGRSPEEVRIVVDDFYASRARAWGLQPGQFPNYQSAVARGWKSTSSGYSRVGASSYAFNTFDMGTVVVESDGQGGSWLLADSATSRALGGWAGVVSLGCATEPGICVDGTVRCTPRFD